MHEILRGMGRGCRVLDLGCKDGSFGMESCPEAWVIRLDRQAIGLGSQTGRLDPQSGWLIPAGGGGFVQADAAHLPFADGAFDAIVANHSLEHLDDVDGALREIGRVIRRSGGLFVAVPDGSTLTDRIYRWIYHGGEHVNLFCSAEDLAQRIRASTGLELVAVRVLHSSLFFLNRAIFQPRPPRRLWLFAYGDLRAIAWLTYVFRIADKLLGTRLSVYGWALYFGQVAGTVETEAWTNVCVGCGIGRSSAALLWNGHVRKARFRPATYRCPSCSAWNLFTSD